MIAAACAGGITRASNGTATRAMPPPKPPLEIPAIRIAGTAAR